MCGQNCREFSLALSSELASYLRVHDRIMTCGRGGWPTSRWQLCADRVAIEASAPQNDLVCWNARQFTLEVYAVEGAVDSEIPNQLVLARKADVHEVVHIIFDRDDSLTGQRLMK